MSWGLFLILVKGFVLILIRRLSRTRSLAFPIKEEQDEKVTQDKASVIKSF